MKNRKPGSVGYTLQLNLPIYQGGLILSKSREAIHLYTQAAQELEKTRRSVQRRTHEAFLGVASIIFRIKALAQALRSTEATLRSTQMGFQVGTRTSVDVLDAQREMLRAKRDYASARYDYILDVLRLKQAAGTLSDEDIVAINTWFDISERQSFRKFCVEGAPCSIARGYQIEENRNYSWSTGHRKTDKKTQQKHSKSTPQTPKKIPKKVLSSLGNARSLKIAHRNEVHSPRESKHGESTSQERRLLSFQLDPRRLKALPLIEVTPESCPVALVDGDHVVASTLP